MFKKRKRPKTLRTVLSRTIHLSRRRIYVGMQYITPVTSKQVGEFLVQDMTDKIKYAKGVFECASFALGLAANAKRRFYAKDNINPAIGICWTKKHAFNFYITPEYKISYIEPQTDRVMFPTEKIIFLQI